VLNQFIKQVLASALLIGVPLVYSQDFFLSFELPKVLFFRFVLYLLVVVVGFQLVGMDVGRARIADVMKKGWFKWLAWMIGVFMIYGVLGSIEPFVGFWGSYFRQQGVFQFLHYILFWLVLVVGFSKEELVGVLKWSLVGVVGVLVVGVLQWFGIYLGNFDTDVFLGRIFSTLGHPNFLAFYLLLMFFPLLWLMMEMKRKNVLLLIGLGVVLVGILGGIILTQSRSAMLGLAVGVGFLLVDFGANSGRVKLARWIGVVVSAALGLGVWRVVVYGEGLRSVMSRIYLWKATLAGWADAPVFGFGVETYREAVLPYLSPDINSLELMTQMPDRAHNVLIQILSDFGAVGVLMFCLAVFWVVRFGRKKARVLVAGVIAILVAAMFGFFMTTHFVVLVFVLALMTKIVSKDKVVDLRKEFGKWKVWVAGMLSLVLLFGVLVPLNVGKTMADLSFKIGYKTGSEQALLDTERSNPYQHFYRYYTANFYLNSPELDDASSKASYYIEEGLEFTSGRNGLFLFMNLRSMIENMDEHGEKKKAVQREFLKLAEMMPSYPPLYMEVGKYYFRVNDRAASLEVFERYMEVVPEYWSYPEDSFEYGQFYKANPNFGEVFEYLVELYEMGGYVDENVGGNVEKADFYRKYIRP